MKKNKWKTFCDTMEEIIEFITIFGTLAVVIIYMVCSLIFVGIKIFG